jgi:xylono-1,5-lactonase
VTTECVWPAAATLGEGPVWLAAEKALYWVDIKAPAIHRYTPRAGARESWRVPEPIGCLCPRAKGGFVAGLKGGFAFMDCPESPPERLGGPESDRPGNRVNDGKVDAKGRLWTGTMDDSEIEATGALYRLDADHSWHRLDCGYVITNGPAFSPDGATLYHTDTLKREISAFDLAADGSLSNKRPFIAIPEDQGYPDGMTVDAEGCLWVAHFGGWRVTRFDPDGTPMRYIPLPVSNITSCTFGGEALDVLYITSATKGLSCSDIARQPMAGGLFAVDAGISGLPANAYAG